MRQKVSKHSYTNAKIWHSAKKGSFFCSYIHQDKMKRLNFSDFIKLRPIYVSVRLQRLRSSHTVRTARTSVIYNQLFTHMLPVLKWTQLFFAQCLTVARFTAAMYHIWQEKMADSKSSCIIRFVPPPKSRVELSLLHAIILSSYDSSHPQERMGCSKKLRIVTVTTFRFSLLLW